MRSTSPSNYYYSYDCEGRTSLVTPSDAYRLYFSGNPVTTIPSNATVEMTRIQYLHLEYNNIESIETYGLNGPATLIEIHLNHNNLQNLASEAFYGLTGLQKLKLNNNKLKSLDYEVFNSLSQLQELYLQNNELESLASNSALSVFSPLTSLKNLDLSINRLTDIGINLFDDLTALKTLAINYNLLHSLHIGVFSTLSKLTTLNIKGNPIQFIECDSSMSAFTGLSSLPVLDLENARLTRIDTCMFSGLTALTFLSLKSNVIDYIAPGSFANVGGINLLNLQDNNLRNLETDAFKGLNNLATLDLIGNELTVFPASAFSPLDFPSTWGKISGSGADDKVMVSLSGNPLSCHLYMCWLTGSDTLVETDNFTCLDPVKDQTWDARVAEPSYQCDTGM